ncbi:phenylacetate--CoA ligase family protein [Saccharospirillum impatiens]|uniref:phenylacetate--CoA ligase family protein n=1 Tax=Saccharospirillum impatiens TaxID=169438 RepID=UPI0004049E82|nr:phenylacetate--CoA ligase family protein [Saccharospirillum impatiens]
MSVVEQIFYRLPVFIQEALLYVIGMYVYFQRRSGDYYLFLKEVEENSYLDHDRIDAIKNSNVKEVLASAKEVPAYRKLFDSLGDNDNDALGVLKKFPVLEKKTLKLEGRKYISDKNVNLKLLKLKTTGSTGTPLEIFCTAEARKRNYAYFDWFIRIHGATPRDKSITIAGRKIRPASGVKPPYWLLDRFNRTLYMSAYHINDSSLREYCKAINAYKPIYIDSYPSVLYEISNFAITNGISLPTPKFICTSSETLSGYQRRAIEHAFGCPVRNQYGTAEMCVFGYECQNGSMHIREDYGLAEFVDTDETGQSQEIICTGFINHAMPLIRYRIGDTVKVIREDRCECGSHYPIVRGIEGRVDDVVISKSGKKYSRLSPILKGLPILESQYIQVSMSLITLKVIPEREFDDGLKCKILAKLKEYFVNDFDFEVIFVKEIPRGKGGKFRSVINLCK